MSILTSILNRRIKKTMAAGLVPLLLLASVPGCAARHDWRRVQAVVPETEMEVQLHEDGTPYDARKIKGRFLAATDDSVTLRFKDGGTDVLQRRDVRKILTWRPVAKRWPAWVTLGVSAVVVSALLGNLDGPESNRFFIQLYTTLPLTTAVFFGTKMGGIYEGPPNHRDWYPQETSSATGKGETPKSGEGDIK